MKGRLLKDYYIGKKLVGQLVIEAFSGDKVYVSHRNRGDHEFHKTRGWGLAMDILSELEAKKVKKIIIVLDDEEIYLETNPLEFRVHGMPFRKPPYEPQYILPEVHFIKRKFQDPSLGRFL